MDLYQIWFKGSSRGRNQLCGIFLQSAHGFRFCEGSKFAISHCLGWSLLTQCWPALPCSLWQVYLVPFSSYLTLNNIMTLKSVLEVTQDHSSWYHLKTWVQRSIVTMALSCMITEIKQHFGRKSWFFDTSLTFNASVRGVPIGILPYRLVWKN